LSVLIYPVLLPRINPPLFVHMGSAPVPGGSGGGSGAGGLAGWSGGAGEGVLTGSQTSRYDNIYR
jgi:hypothetical protein